MSHVSQSFTCLKNILFFGQPAHCQESHLDLRRNIPGTKRLRQSNIDETDGDQHQLKQDLDNVNHLASLDLQPNFWGLGMACQGKMDRFIGIFSLSSTVLSCAAVFLLCCFKRLKKNNSLIQIVMETLHTEKQQQRNYRYSY